MIQFYQYYRIHGPQSAHVRQAEEKLAPRASDVQEKSAEEVATTPHTANHVPI